MRAGEAISLVLAIAICELAGVVGSVFAIGSIPTWYVTLQKPWFTPPNWAFGPVWVALYLLQGVSLYLIWRAGTGDGSVRAALGLFASQLVLNSAWSYLFFGLHLLLYSLVEIVVLWIAIALTIAAAVRVSRKSGALLIPYIAWVTLATGLTYYVWLLNP